MLGIYWELQTKFGNLMGFCWVFLNMPKFPMLGIFPLYPGLELLGNFKTKLGICWDFIGYFENSQCCYLKIPNKIDIGNSLTFTTLGLTFTTLGIFRLGFYWVFIGYFLGIHWESEKIPIWESGIFSCEYPRKVGSEL